MPEKHSGPAMPGGTARPYVKRSCAWGAVQDIKIFNGGGGGRPKTLTQDKDWGKNGKNREIAFSEDKVSDIARLSAVEDSMGR